MTLAPFVFCAVLALSEGAERAGEAQQQALCRRLASRDAKMHAIAIEYEEIPRNVPGKPVGSYSRRVVAARAPSWFMRDNGHGHKLMHWEDDPLRKTRYVAPGRVLLFTNLARTLYEKTSPSKEHASREPTEELFFQVFCWWPFTDWTAPTINGRKWTMESLLADGKYKLASAPQIIRGISCLILEDPGSDTLWIDALKPDCIVQREVFDSESGFRMARYEFDDYAEFEDGIWLPSTFRSIQFDPYASTEALRSRRVIDTTFQLKVLAINEAVDDTYFNLTLPPGSVRRTDDKKTERYVLLSEGEEEFAQDLLQWLRRMLGKPRGKENWLSLSPQILIALFLGMSFTIVIRGLVHRRQFGDLSPTILDHQADQP
jgi:hypothetical protein